VTPARIHHGAALAHARRILSQRYSPASPLVRIARAYVDLHDKTTGVLRGTLAKVDALLNGPTAVDFDAAARAAREEASRG
jgi:hypothetical protein